jgi:hypothetical protein
MKGDAKSTPQAGWPPQRRQPRAADKEHPMPNPQVVTKIALRHMEDLPDATFVSAAKACADCALRKGPACPDCIDHALRGLGFVHWTRVVRH